VPSDTDAAAVSFLICTDISLGGEPPGYAGAGLGSSWGQPPAAGVRCGRINPEPGPQRAQIGGRRGQLAIHLPRHRSQGRGVASLVGREQAGIQGVDVSHP
jgi:hypothetical protein